MEGLEASHAVSAAETGLQHCACARRGSQIHQPQSQQAMRPQ